MFIILGLVVVVFMFYKSADEAKKSKTLWTTIGLGIYFILGLTFFIITDKYILHIETFEDAISTEMSKSILSAVSMLIIIAISYLIKAKFLVKKR